METKAGLAPRKDGLSLAALKDGERTELPEQHTPTMQKNRNS